MHDLIKIKLCKLYKRKLSKAMIEVFLNLSKKLNIKMRQNAKQVNVYFSSLKGLFLTNFFRIRFPELFTNGPWKSDEKRNVPFHVKSDIFPRKFDSTSLVYIKLENFFLYEIVYGWCLRHSVHSLIKTFVLLHIQLQSD